MSLPIPTDRRNSASDSELEDEEQPETDVTRPAQQTSAKERDSPDIEADLKQIKEILVKLSEKIDKNERVLQEIQVSR